VKKKENKKKKKEQEQERMYRRARERFNLMLLEEGEIYLEDYGYFYKVIIHSQR
jgi:hypothetical protein